MPVDRPVENACVPEDASYEAVAALADRVRLIAAAPTPQDLLAAFLRTATEAVPGCEHAGITVLRSGHGIDNPLSYSEFALHCDQLQEQLGEGPCLTALSDEATIRVDEIVGDTRWPRFSGEAAARGVRSMLSCPVSTSRERLGALNLYATTAGAFPRGAEHIARAFATHVGILLGAALKEQNLQVALRSRELIGQAMGILMERHRVTASQAFDLMVHTSQRTHVKLRTLAEDLVRTGELLG